MAGIGVDHLAYGGRTYNGPHDLCWIRPNPIYHATFLGPIAVTLTFNLAMIGVALFKVCGMRSKPKLLGQARGFLSLTFLLGGTWVLELMRVNLWPSSAGLMYVCTALNSFQGLFIFFFYVVLSKKSVAALRRGLLQKTSTMPSAGISTYEKENDA